MDNRQKLINLLSDFIEKVAVYLPDDVESAIIKLAAEETGETAKQMYGCITENVKLAKKLHRPLCQDTGVLQFFITVGTAFPHLNILKDCIIEAVKKATASVPLRPNVVYPLGETNTGCNVGYGAPYFEWDIVPDSDECQIGLYLAGGGCSLPGRSKVLMPLEGENGIKDLVADTVLNWGVNACPPLFLCIGIGTCAATSAMLSKKALFRPIGSKNSDEKVAKLEAEITDELNAIGIAPLGFGGKNSVMAVHIETAGRHPATLGVGITTGCWATRRGILTLDKDLNGEIPTHKNAKEN